ncbi:MAG TPA: type VI secretion system contractile sheath large subunit [Micropepsaceae bacterium]
MELDANVMPRQADLGPPPEAAENREDLRERLIRYLEGIAGVRDGDAGLPLDQLATQEALAAWFGPSFTELYGKPDALRQALDRDVAAIDDFISNQVNAILHDASFQRLETAWRGVQFLTGIAAEISGAKIRVLPVSWNEIARDLDRAGDFDQSQIFQKIYSNEFGTPGGEPFGLLIGDYAIHHQRTADHPTDDIGALKSLASVAAASFAPLVLGVSPSVFQLNSFSQLGRPIELRTIFAQGEYQRWNAMRQNEDLRFAGLVLPRLLMRLPYVDDPLRRDGFHFAEHTDSRDGSGYLWGNAAYAFGATVLRAFGNFGWFADIRGAPRDELRGGLVYGNPIASFATDSPGIALKPSTECLISEHQERDLTELGFIPLRDIAFTEFSVFNESPSLHMPERYDRQITTINARISAMLPYVLCVSRFAHFIKIMARERIGSFSTADDCQAFLQTWLGRYCEGSSDASAETRARYPLREGTIQVKNVPGKPGTYSCTVLLRPQYQFDEVSAGFRLVTELSPAN